MLIVGTKSVRTSVSGRHLHLHIPPPCLVLGGSRLRHLSGHLNQAGGGSFVDLIKPTPVEWRGFISQESIHGEGDGFWFRIRFLDQVRVG